MNTISQPLSSVLLKPRDAEKEAVDQTAPEGGNRNTSASSFQQEITAKRLSK